MFRRVLIANRGEIAVRIARTLRELGIEAVALYTDVDRAALHVRRADRAVGLGADPRAYLDGERIVELALGAGCDALHPGYGFLSENDAFAELCAARGVTFIGPPPSAIRAMGSKERARAAMAAAGVPIVPGGSARTLEEARATADRIGYPVMVKATDGGGGKGMRFVANAADLASALERTRSEAAKAFGNGDVYLEKALLEPRHVEVQVLGDQHGNLIHLFERDCSLQRRHQKIIEEAPCPVMDPATRKALCNVAVQGARAIGYYSAGTFEFLLDRSGAFYFLEMNTRLQVEHPVTELITGVDLVREMVRVAAGEPLEVGTPELRGAAIEARVYAEDATRGFVPSPGTVERLAVPGGPGVRDDSGIYEGAEVSSHYDPLLAKLSVWAPTREQAIARMTRALGEYHVGGMTTNLAFLERLVASPEMAKAAYDTGFVERHAKALNAGPATVPGHAATAGDAATAAAAVAIAAEAAAFRDKRTSEAPPSTDGPTPWVAAHRARLLGH